MAKIFNSNLTKELVDGAKLQTAFDKVPSELAEKVVPVMEVNPKLLRKTNLVLNGSRTASGAAITLITPSSDKKTFITGIRLSVVKDATCDASSSDFSIRGTIKDGGSTVFCSLPLLTLTAQDSNIFVKFDPIELEPTKVLNMDSLTFTAGSAISSCNVYGYQIENPRA